jgi:hypothetical protein
MGSCTYNLVIKNTYIHIQYREVFPFLIFILVVHAQLFPSVRLNVIFILRGIGPGHVGPEVHCLYKSRAPQCRTQHKEEDQ